MTNPTTQLLRLGITHAWLNQEVEAGRLPFNIQAVEDALLRRATGGKDDG